MAPVKKRQKRGLTLIEVLITLVVLGVILVPTFLALAAAFRNSEDAKNATVAAHLAQEKMEELVRTPFGSIASGSDGSGTASPFTGEFVNFSRNWTVAASGAFSPGSGSDPHTAAGAFKKITLTVKHVPSLVAVTLVRYVAP